MDVERRTKPIGRGGPEQLGSVNAAQQAPCNVDTTVDRSKPRGTILASKLVPPQELTTKDGQLLLQNASLYRILYVSTVQDNSDKKAVCGTVVIPTNSEAVNKYNQRPRLVSWSHGTVGLPAECQPGQKPLSGIVGKMPGGIGSISSAKSKQYPETGALQTLVNQGTVVVASDYYTGLGTNDDLQPYMAGRVAAANTLDAVGAAGNLITQLSNGTATSLNPNAQPKAVLWGHSQGGATAMFAGQLWSKGYAPVDESGKKMSTLVGISLAAPASNLVGDGENAKNNFEIGLGDAVMHRMVNPLGEVLPDDPETNQMLDEIAAENPELKRMIEGKVLPIAPILFTQIFKGWEKLALTDAGGDLPAHPNTGLLPSTVFKDGSATAERLKLLCVGLGSRKEVKEMLFAVAPYSNSIPAHLREKFFQPPFNDTDTQGVRKTCDKALPKEYAPWCQWLQWNTDGPAGSNPYSQPPKLEGSETFVPVYIAQGTDDDIVVCQSNKATVPPPDKPCMARALHRRLQVLYSRNGSYLKLGYFNNIGHLKVMKASSQAGSTGSDQQVFEGSPVAKFFDGAFSGTLTSKADDVVSTEIPGAIPPEIWFNGRTVPGDEWGAGAITEPPKITWATAVQDDSAIVNVVHTGPQTTKNASAPYGTGTVDLVNTPGVFARGFHGIQLTFTSGGVSQKMKITYKVSK